MQDAITPLLLLVKAVPLAFLALFPVINPIGTAVILLGMTGPIDSATRRTIAAKIAFNTFMLLAVVLFVGSYLLSFFGLTIPIVQAAGGLVLAAMGWRMLNQDDSTTSQSPGGAAASYGDRLFYPFTFPITVGPGCIAVALTLSAHTQNEAFVNTACRQAGAVIGIIGVCVAVYLSFAYSELLARRLGASGTKVMLRMMAFIVVCLGAEIFWNGAAKLIQQSLMSK